MTTVKSKPDGYRWVVAIRYEDPFEMVSRFPAEALGVTINGTPADMGEPTAFIVADHFDLGKTKGEFATPQEAAAEADRLNLADAQRGLDQSEPYKSRRECLRALGETFWVAYGGEGHPESRWPSQPGRFAVERWSDRYSESFWDTYDDRAEIEKEIQTGNAERIVDLDTSQDVPFTVSVNVEWPEG